MKIQHCQTLKKKKVNDMKNPISTCLLRKTLHIIIHGFIYIYVCVKKRSIMIEDVVKIDDPINTVFSLCIYI